MFFVIPSPNPVVIPLDLLKIRGALMQKANVNHGKLKIGKMVERRELHCIRRSVSLYSGRVVRGAGIMLMERKKVMKKGRRSKRIDAKRVQSGFSWRSRNV
jgi:hypothetical protein